MVNSSRAEAGKRKNFGVPSQTARINSTANGLECKIKNVAVAFFTRQPASITLYYWSVISRFFFAKLSAFNPFAGLRYKIEGFTQMH